MWERLGSKLLFPKEFQEDFGNVHRQQCCRGHTMQTLCSCSWLGWASYLYSVSFVTALFIKQQRSRGGSSRVPFQTSRQADRQTDRQSQTHNNAMRWNQSHAEKGTIPRKSLSSWSGVCRLCALSNVLGIEIGSRIPYDNCLLIRDERGSDQDGANASPWSGSLCPCPLESSSFEDEKSETVDSMLVSS